MNNLNPIVKKMIDSGNMSNAEWNILLNEWDETNRISWKSEDNGVSLLNYWCRRQIPATVVQRLTEKYGPEFWTQPSHDSALSALVHFVFNQRSSAVVEQYAQTLFTSFGPEVIAEELRKRPIANFANTWYSNAPTPVVLSMLLSQWDAPVSMKGLFTLYPQLLTTVHDNHPLDEIFTKDNIYFEVFLKAGGSLFAEFNGTPLWQRLMHKKIYHHGLKTVLEKGLTRMLENSAPQEDSIVFSETDWNKLAEQKTTILKERSIFEFERDLEKDWRKALKANKEWRKWVNPEGANVMHWLALKDPANFARSGVSKKINHSLISQTDTQGCDTLPYFCLGLGLAVENMSWRKQNRFINDVVPDFIKAYAPLCNPTPHKGVFAALLEASTDGFFKSERSLGTSESYRSILKQLSESMASSEIFVAGMETTHWMELLYNTNKNTRFSSAIGQYYAELKDFPSLLNTNDKIVFCAEYLNHAFTRLLSHEASADFLSMIRHLTQLESNEHSVSDRVLKTLAHSHSGNSTMFSDAARDLKSWAEKQILLRSLYPTEESAEKSPEDSTNRRRKM